jgi:TPR repeat protein
MMKNIWVIFVMISALGLFSASSFANEFAEREAGGEIVNEFGQQIMDAVPDMNEYRQIPRGLLLEVEVYDPLATEVKEEKTVTTINTENVNTINIAEMLDALKRGEKNKALEQLTQLADKGHILATESLGLIYLQGIGGVPKDLAKAVDYLTRAAEFKRGLAMHHLANMTFRGEGQLADKVKAYMWITLASVYYTEAERRAQAQSDKTAIGSHLTRTEQARGEQMAYQWARAKGDERLLQDVVR